MDDPILQTALYCKDSEISKQTEYPSKQLCMQTLKMQYYSTVSLTKMIERLSKHSFRYN